MIRQTFLIAVLIYVALAAPPEFLSKLHRFNTNLGKSLFEHLKTSPNATVQPPSDTTTEKRTSSNLKDFFALLERPASIVNDTIVFPEKNMVIEITSPKTTTVPSQEAETIFLPDKNLIIEIVTENSHRESVPKIPVVDEFDSARNFHTTTTESVTSPTENCDTTAATYTDTAQIIDVDAHLGLTEVYKKLRESIKILREIFSEDISRTGGEMKSTLKNHFDTFATKIKRLHALSAEIIKMLLHHQEEESEEQVYN